MDGWARSVAIRDMGQLRGSGGSLKHTAAFCHFLPQTAMPPPNDAGSRLEKRLMAAPAAFYFNEQVANPGV
ncbi:hypothetical protein PproGo58_25080 [Pseudomonas protegens]|nr:hypothetical protein PproGo58_25080 [Pseudomonas protegens]